MFGQMVGQNKDAPANSVAHNDYIAPFLAHKAALPFAQLLFDASEHVGMLVQDNLKNIEAMPQARVSIDFFQS
ncbi:MAG: hypothetical protein BGN94_12415 [Rhizobiales bacterium 68-8]|nr:MAG: hypothetical protein BGN94_12415 [Rhizobiales bacterium 68-8]